LDLNDQAHRKTTREACRRGLRRHLVLQPKQRVLELTLEQTLAAKSEDAIQQKAGLPAASIGCTFEFAGRRFLRTGPRTAKCLAPDCPTKGGQQFGLHSYGNMQIAQHAGACIRNNGAKVRAGASKLARAENKAEAHQDAEASWILGDRQLPQNRSVVGVCLLPSRSWVLTAVSTPHFGSCSNSSSSAKPPIYSLPRWEQTLSACPSSSSICCDFVMLKYEPATQNFQGNARCRQGPQRAF
jgi:hypothetical protein